MLSGHLFKVEARNVKECKSSEHFILVELKVRFFYKLYKMCFLNVALPYVVPCCEPL